jgi:hypothetical protein
VTYSPNQDTTDMTSRTNISQFAEVITEFNCRIAELEKEVGFAAFPYTRASYVREKLGVDEKDADPEKLDDALGGWLAFLSMIKFHKDNNSQAWTKMRNWD